MTIIYLNLLKLCLVKYFFFLGYGGGGYGGGGGYRGRGGGRGGRGGGSGYGGGRDGT